MKRLIFIALVASNASIFADPGIMIEIDIIIDRPSGTGQIELGQEER